MKCHEQSGRAPTLANQYGAVCLWIHDRAAQMIERFTSLLQHTSSACSRTTDPLKWGQGKLPWKQPPASNTSNPKLCPCKVRGQSMSPVPGKFQERFHSSPENCTNTTKTNTEVQTCNQHSSSFMTWTLMCLWCFVAGQAGSTWINQGTPSNNANLSSW